MKNIYISTHYLRSNSTAAVHLTLSRFSMDNLETFAVIQADDDWEWLRETGWLEHFHGTVASIPNGADAVVIGNEVDFLWCSGHPTARKARPDLMGALSSRWQFTHPTHEEEE